MNPSTPTDTLSLLANDPERGVSWTLALNPSTPSDVLAPLAAQMTNDPEEWVRESIAEDPRASAEILALLANDPSQVVRDAVAANPSTPTDTLTQLANDPDSGVREAIAENPNTPAHTLIVLSIKGFPFRLLEEFIFLTPNGLELVASRLLMDGPSYPDSADDIASLLIAHPFTPSNVIQELATSPMHEVRAIAASSPRISSDTLNTLTRDNHPDVRRAATEELNRRQ